MPPIPIKKITAYACGLAAVVYNLAQSKAAITQEDVLRDHLDSFPKWKSLPGFIAPWEILKLMSLLGYDADDFVATKSFDEAFDYVGGHRPFAMYYWIRKIPDLANGTPMPGNHCMALVRLERQEIEVMEPDYGEFIRFNRAKHTALHGTILICSGDVLPIR
jgi:hypothetical protein